MSTGLQNFWKCNIWLWWASNSNLQHLSDWILCQLWQLVVGLWTPHWASVSSLDERVGAGLRLWLLKLYVGLSWCFERGFLGAALEEGILELLSSYGSTSSHPSELCRAALTLSKYFTFLCRVLFEERLLGWRGKNQKTTWIIDYKDPFHLYKSMTFETQNMSQTPVY